MCILYLQYGPIKNSFICLFQGFAEVVCTDRNNLADLQKYVTYLLDLLFESTPLHPVRKKFMSVSKKSF